MVPAAVFIDFDGTITVKETFVRVLRRFSPQKAEALIPEILNERLTLREGVRAILEDIDSDDFPALLGSTASASIRPGFDELLDELVHRGLPVVVVSGGLRAIIETVLGPARCARLAGLHAVDVDLSGPKLKPRSRFEDGDELVAKVAVAALYPAIEVVAIGDSLTDLNLALRADLVFARGRLQDYLDDRAVSYRPWTDFHDVRAQLAAHWSSP